MNHQPQLPPLELLHRLWPLNVNVFRLPLPKSIPEGHEKPLQETHWLIVASVVASQIIAMTKSTLDPRLAYGLVMESAVITWKIDPETIEPGKWRIGAVAGKVTIERLKR